MVSAHTTVQEHIGHLTSHDPIGCDQKQFYIFIVYFFIKYTAFIVVPLQRRVQVNCLYHYSQERLVVYSLATAKRVHTSGGNCIVYLPDKGTRSIWAAKGGWVFYYKSFTCSYRCLNHAAKFKLQTSKYRSCCAGCMALWRYKSMLGFASKQLRPQKWKSMSNISDPMPKKKAEVCSKTWKKAKVWRLAKSMWNTGH